MDYRLYATSDQLVVHLSGRLTASDVLLVRKLLNEVEQACTAPTVLDLRDLEFVDSAGLGFLIQIRARVRRAGFALSLSGAGGAVAKVLSMTRLDKFLSEDPAMTEPDPLG